MDTNQTTSDVERRDEIYLGDDPERAMLLRGMLDALDGTISQDATIEPASRETLDKVLDYLSHHRDEDMSAQPEERAPYRPSAWDDQFISAMDTKLLFDVIQVANYLDMKPLLNLGTGKVAQMIKGKTPQQIGELFNIGSDITQEEEAVIIREEFHNN